MCMMLEKRRNSYQSRFSQIRKRALPTDASLVRLYMDWSSRSGSTGSGLGYQPRSTDSQSWERSQSGRERNPHTNGTDLLVFQIRSPLITVNGIPSTKHELYSSCKLIGAALGISRRRWGCHSVATFFKEMTSRDIIIGINLTRSRSLSKSH